MPQDPTRNSKSESIRVSDFLRDAQARQPSISGRPRRRFFDTRQTRTLFGVIVRAVGTTLRSATFGPLGHALKFIAAIALYFGLMHLDLETGYLSNLTGVEQSGGIVTLSAPASGELVSPD